MKRSKLCLWRPLTRSAGRAYVGPGSGGALGDKLLEERGFVTMVPSVCPAPERRRPGDRDAHAQHVQRGVNNDPHPSRDSSRFFTKPTKP